MDKEMLQIKIKKRLNDGDLLEAFLLQSTYIESLMKRYAELVFYLAVESKISKSNKGQFSNVITVLKKRIDKYGFDRLIKFFHDSRLLSLTEKKSLSSYSDKRNTIIHDVLKQISAEDFKEKINKTLDLGNSILDLRRFQIIKKAIIGNIQNFPRLKPVSEREEQIIKMRLDGFSLAVVSKKFNITRERVRQIQNKVLRDYSGIQEKITKLIPAPIIIYELPESINDIIQIFAKRYGVGKKEVFGRGRMANVVLVRHLIMYFLRQNLKLSFPKIGKIMHRDHTSVIHACNSIDRLIKEGKINIK